MSLRAVWGAMVKRQLKRARNFEREQERRLLGTYDPGHKKRRERRGASGILLRKLLRSARR